MRVCHKVREGIRMVEPHVWYKDGATVVAAVALAVSLVSSLISMWHTRAQDRQTAHVDLRVVLQRLLSISLDNRERIAKYNEQIAKCESGGKSEENEKTIATSRESIAFVNTLALQEMNVLASQGAKSARLLGRKLVASPEYLTIARAQAEAGNFEAQGEFIKLACDTAKTPMDRLSALRDSATYLFSSGRVPEGRVDFAAQVEILKNVSHYAPAFIASANVELQLAWGRMEENLAGDTQAAQEHLSVAINIANSVGPGDIHDALMEQIHAAFKPTPQGATGTVPGPASVAPA
jgi:tetratricopeptide (TPR) repeat protein